MKNLSDMKNIEDIIRNNKDFFEDAEPSKGHFERFNRKLEIRFQVKCSQKKYCSLPVKSSSCNLAGYSFLTLDMGSFYPSGKQQDDTWTGLSTIQRG